MFKRVERKRERQEEEEELGLDEDMKEIMGLNDTDSDESDDSDGGDIREESAEDNDQEKEDAASDDEHVNEEPISVAEALKDPIYLISLNPTVYGCVLCKGKLIKNAGMAAAHKNANAHMRRFEHFRRLSADADLRGNAWELIRSIGSVSKTQSVESQNLSKRALKRQAKLAAVREKRRYYKDLKTKAIAKKALKNPSTTDETKNDVPSSVDSKDSPASRAQSEKPRKKQKLGDRTSTTRFTRTPDATAESVSHTKISDDDKKSVCLESKHKGRRKSN